MQSVRSGTTITGSFLVSYWNLPLLLTEPKSRAPLPFTKFRGPFFEFVFPRRNLRMRERATRADSPPSADFSIETTRESSIHRG